MRRVTSSLLRELLASSIIGRFITIQELQLQKNARLYIMNENFVDALICEHCVISLFKYLFYGHRKSVSFQFKSLTHSTFGVRSKVKLPFQRKSVINDSIFCQQIFKLFATPVFCQLHFPHIDPSSIVIKHEHSVMLQVKRLHFSAAPKAEDKFKRTRSLWLY